MKLQISILYSAAPSSASVATHRTWLSCERGPLMLGCGKSVIRVAPALSIKTGEIDAGLQIFEEALTLAEKESGT